MKQETLELNDFEIHDAEKLEGIPLLDALYDSFRINMFMKSENKYVTALLIANKDFSQCV